MPGPDVFALLGREVLRERLGALVAETCAWAVGISDRPHLERRAGRVSGTGATLGERAGAGRRLGEEADTRLDVGDAAPGSFRDALSALTPDGAVYAERYEEQVLLPFVHEVGVLTVTRAAAVEPDAWQELVDDVGEDDPVAVVPAAEWEAPLLLEAQHLVLTAIGSVPLLQVEAEGLSLAVVRAAERETRAAAPHPVPPAAADDLAGALFLAEAALRNGSLPLPVRPEDSAAAVRVLLAEGIDVEEILRLLPRLPVLPESASRMARLLREPGSGSHGGA